MPSALLCAVGERDRLFSKEDEARKTRAGVKVFLESPMCCSQVFSSPRSPLSLRAAERETIAVKENIMQQAIQDARTQTEQLQTTLEQYIVRISNDVRNFAATGEWEAIKSVLRVLDAHSRAQELRSLGQPARAHLWLVGVGRKRQPSKKVKTSSSPRPAA